MSAQDQIEQRRRADLFHAIQSRTIEQYKIKEPMSKRLKGVAEGYMTTRWAIRLGRTFWPF
jgi:hypothetical protein